MEVQILRTRVNDNTLWYAADLRYSSRWLIQVEPWQRAELLDALAAAKRRGCGVADIGRADFPLPCYGAELARLGRQLDEGCGFRVLRGLPIEGLPLEDVELLYAGLTAHLGEMINQDTAGTLIDRVFDRGGSYDDIKVRGYTTNAQLTPHCDSGDLVGLLCVRPARSGGMNNISCSMAVYNELIEHYPEYLEPLYRGFYYNIRGNGPLGEFRDVTSHRVPVFSFHQGRLSCRYNQKAILTAAELPGVPRLSGIEKDAINCVAELAMRDDIRFDVYLEAGDLAFLNNNTVLHNRDHFVDFEEEERKRLLLRQWINLDHARELTFDFADHYNTGPRRGPAIHHPEPQMVAQSGSQARVQVR